jgi:ribosomal protein L11 methyltransferase
VAEALFGAGVAGVEELEQGLRTHVPEVSDLAALRSAVLAADPGADFSAELAAPVDWTEAWKHGVGAHSVGSLTIAPPWLASMTPRDHTIVIDPGTAFGTGEHPTTRGVARLMPRFLHEGDHVADLGAGSAVLSIAAAKLGAEWAAAIEVDEEAIANAEENVEANGMTDRVKVICGDAAAILPLVAPVDLVLANIISSVLTGLLPIIGRALAPGGTAILSGILLDERAEFIEVLTRGGWRVVAEDTEAEWWTVAVAP